MDPQRRRLHLRRFDMEPLRDVRCRHGLRGQMLTGTAYDAVRREWRFGFDLGGTVTVAALDPEQTEFVDYERTLFREVAPGLKCLCDDRLGQRLEIEVFSDDPIEVSRFVGNEDIEGGVDLLKRILAEDASP